MEGLQRSAVSFRRQGSSGIVWDDRFLAELSQMKPEQQPQEEQGEDTNKQEEEKQAQVQSNTTNNNDNDNNPEKIDVVKDVKPTIAPIKIERSRSNGEKRGYRTGKVSPAIEPPSPKVSACGFCSVFGKQKQSDKKHRKKPDKFHMYKEGKELDSNAYRDCRQNH